MHYVYSVNFQYKSPKTTYDLYAGATYMRVYTVLKMFYIL